MFVLIKVITALLTYRLLFSSVNLFQNIKFHIHMNYDTVTYIT